MILIKTNMLYVQINQHEQFEKLEGMLILPSGR